MRLLTTALTSSLILALAVTACGDDEDDDGTGGRGGTGGAAGTSGSGGSGGKAGSGGNAGTGGGDGGDIAACVQRAQSTFGTCQPLAECSCNNCKDELEACYADPGCVRIRECVRDTGCCPPQLVDVCGHLPDCTNACLPVIQDTGTSVSLASALSVCVYVDNECPPCPFGDGGGTDGGAGDASTD